MLVIGSSPWISWFPFDVFHCQRPPNAFDNVVNPLYDHCPNQTTYFSIAMSTFVAGLCLLMNAPSIYNSSQMIICKRFSILWWIDSSRGKLMFHSYPNSWHYSFHWDNDFYPINQFKGGHAFNDFICYSRYPKCSIATIILGTRNFIETTTFIS